LCAHDDRDDRRIDERRAPQVDHHRSRRQRPDALAQPGRLREIPVTRERDDGDAVVLARDQDRPNIGRLRGSLHR